MCRPLAHRDGDANTRDPEDLVGQGVAAWDASIQGRRGAEVMLEGRGLFGKFLTSRR